MTCSRCAGLGHLVVEAVESHQTHWRRKGQVHFAVVDRVIHVRVACACEAGERWIDGVRRSSNERVRTGQLPDHDEEVRR